MVKKKEDIKKEETKTEKEIIQEAKERYPCFKCEHLRHSSIFTVKDKRPTRVCKKIRDGTTPDVCNLFKEQKEVIHYIPKIQPPKPTSEIIPPPKPKRSLFGKRTPKQNPNIITDCTNKECSHSKENKCTFPKGLTTCEAHK